MSNWRPWYGELDEDNNLVFGKFKICTTCANPLPSLAEEENHWARDRSWELNEHIICMDTALESVPVMTRMAITFGKEDEE